ncbi:hypothetical protein [Citreimonas sp.]|uniref:hypothetical protein n=1 Tax=Citreimonas sp. TaxID=3036715 RepID=UPI00405A2D01
MIPAPLIALAGIVSASAASAQQDQPVTAEDIAVLAADVCVVADEAPALVDQFGAFTRTEGDDTAATYTHPAGPSLALAVRDGFFSCELTIPEASEDFFDALYRSFAIQLRDRHNADDFEQVEDGQVWEIYTDDGLLIETQLQQDEDGRITLTSSTEPAQTPPRARDDN